MNKILEFYKNNISKEVAFILIGILFSVLTYSFNKYNSYSSEKELIVYNDKVQELNKMLKKSDSLIINLNFDLKYEKIISSLLENINSGLNYNAKTLYKYENNFLNYDSINFYIDSLKQRNFDLIYDIGKINAFKNSNKNYYSEGQIIYGNLLKSELRANNNLLSFFGKKIPMNDSIQESINNYKLNLQTLLTYSENKAYIRREKIDDGDNYSFEINKIKKDFAFNRVLYLILTLFSSLIFVSLILLSFKSEHFKK